MPSLSRVFRFGTTYVRARVRDGEVVWFTRDVAAALGIHRIPHGPLLPVSPAALPGMATTAQVWALAAGAGCAVPGTFRAWMAEASAELAQQPSVRKIPRPNSEGGSWMTPTAATARSSH
ncbi:hypothetical protein [Streptomyces sp. NPDC004267]|uniref:hypothetical protein n=1 Tax=Streptomyces sp. NPDC004267 TaxID=3364694 RepID=UPI0036C69BD5